MRPIEWYISGDMGQYTEQMAGITFGIQDFQSPIKIGVKAVLPGTQQPFQFKETPLTPRPEQPTPPLHIPGRPGESNERQPLKQWDQRVRREVEEEITIPIEPNRQDEEQEAQLPNFEDLIPDMNEYISQYSAFKGIK